MPEHRNKPDIVQTLLRDGVELKPRGRTLWARCPLHADSSPSFKVDPDRQTFHCFGCGARGDAIDFIMQRRRVGFKDALAILGIDADKPRRPDPREAEGKRLVAAFRLWCRDHAIGLASELRCLRRIVSEIRTPDDINRDGWIYHRIPVLEHQLDILEYGDAESKKALREEGNASK